MRNIYLDSDNAVERKRVNVDKNGCPCMGIVCLNGGVCVAGSPPYCICKDGFTGYNCGTPITPQSGRYSSYLCSDCGHSCSIVTSFTLSCTYSFVSAIHQITTGYLN